MANGSNILMYQTEDGGLKTHSVVKSCLTTESDGKQY